MSSVTFINSSHPLVGQWKSTDDFSSVSITIDASHGGFNVYAIDAHDNEVANVYDISFNGEQLNFNAHWTSTGRLITYKFLLQSKKSVSVTYSYTDLAKASTKRASSQSAMNFSYMN